MYYLGVDGGGTKTQALLFDAANGAVRSLRLGPGNLCVLGEAGCVKLFADIARELLADVPISRIAGATFGFAGAGRDAQRQILESVAARMGFKNVHVLTDAQILHYAFFEGSPGILIAAGTGSICLVHSPQRPYHQIGGHGYLLGDLGSGFHIGKLAISHTLTRADAARDPSPLANALLDFYHADHPQALVTLTAASPTPQTFIASCAHLVHDLAAQHDPDALAIVDTAAAALVDLAKTALDLAPTDIPRIALAGGLLHPDSLLAQRFKTRLALLAPNVEYAPQLYPPAAAAVLHAAHHDNHPLTEPHQQILRQNHENSGKSV